MTIEPSLMRTLNTILCLSVLISLSLQAFGAETSPPLEETRQILSRLLKDKDPVLEDYRLFYNAEQARLEGDCVKAANYYAAVIENFPPQTSRFYPLARPRLAEALECQGDLSAAVTQWTAHAEESDTQREKAEALFRASALCYREGDAAVVPDLRRFWLAFPESSLAADARELLKKGDFEPFTPFTDDELFERAKLLLERGEAQQSFEAFERLKHPDAAYWKAEALFRARRYLEATDLFSSFLENKKYRSKRSEILLRLATSSARLGEGDKAIQILEQLIKKEPHLSYSRALDQRLASLYLDGYDFEKTEKILIKMMHHRSGALRHWAEEKLAWAYYKNGRLDESLPLWNKLEKVGKESQARFWKARLADKRGDPEETRALYRSIVEEGELNYYTFLAADHLKQHGEGIQIIPADPKREKKKGRKGWTSKKKKEEPQECLPLEKARELITLRLEDFAQEELMVARQVCSDKLVLTAANAKLALKAQFYPMARDYALSLEPDFKDKETRWIYPRAYPDLVETDAKSRSIDPFLVYAMMRQESAFNPRAVSPMGAQGLLQLMPFTAARFAKKAGFHPPERPFDPQTVMKPEVNIKLALAYMEFLHKEFNGEPALMAAAYNAGEEAVRRWVGGRTDLDLEEFVEEIPYSETRHYVKKVIGYMRTYHLLYD